MGQSTPVAMHETDICEKQGVPGKLKHTGSPEIRFLKAFDQAISLFLCNGLSLFRVFCQSLFNHRVPVVDKPLHLIT